MAQSRSVRKILAGAAKVSRAEARLGAWDRATDAGGETLQHGRAASQPLGPMRAEPPPLSSGLVMYADSSSASEPDEGDASKAESESEPDVAPPPSTSQQQQHQQQGPKALPPLERLLPQQWRSDRHLINAWQKGRDIAAAGGVAWGMGGSEVAAVASRSEEAPRAVDLAMCRCSCPNLRPFCSHLFAAVEASRCDRLRGRAALLCQVRECLRGRPFHQDSAREAAGQALHELGQVVGPDMLAAWALELLFRLQHAGSRRVTTLLKDVPASVGSAPTAAQQLWLELWGPLPGTEREGEPAPADGGEAASRALRVAACNRLRSRSPRGVGEAATPMSEATTPHDASADDASTFVANALRVAGSNLPLSS
eukprot:CAMPEP_0204192526 /NCGR_PEP_ID=MMETSP0361-20130328/60942_1 /ASSEMBLY_ACC=CAM_ASM_000343 /TAXON_ID=268821 /ORGANISM="Scrippsiella Hangoei, Strain SHTV-5" /LENGTH=367 /DNA_ID=CAMNT_0051153615 /DNA_START=14 /DNA_END=1114 /DNA_ORIENTATION=-